LSAPGGPERVGRDETLAAFIDETASHQTYRVAALITRVYRARSLIDELDAVMLRAAHEFGVDPSLELHGHRVFHGQDGWEALHPRQRIAVYGWALEAVALHAEWIFIRGVDRPRHLARYRGRFSEHEAALTFVLEDVDVYAHFHGQKVIVLADECRFARPARRWLEQYTTVGTWGYRPRVLAQIQSLVFANSAEHRAIQAIDMVAYLKNRISSRADTVPAAIKANRALWDRISHLVRVDKVWIPK